jgi:hypothetical protein
VISFVVSRNDPALIEIAGGPVFFGRQPLSLTFAHPITNPIFSRNFRGLRSLGSLANGAKVDDVGHSGNPDVIRRANPKPH